MGCATSSEEKRAQEVNINKKIFLFSIILMLFTIRFVILFSSIVED